MNIKIVREKSTGHLYCVWNITYDKKGHPHFVIYKNNHWVSKNAKHFEPFIES